MGSIFRALGFICAVFFATTSLYCFTAFWSGIGSQIKNENTIVRVSQNINNPISSTKRLNEEKESEKINEQIKYPI